MIKVTLKQIQDTARHLNKDVTYPGWHWQAVSRAEIKREGTLDPPCACLRGCGPLGLTLLSDTRLVDPQEGAFCLTRAVRLVGAFLEQVGDMQKVQERSS